MKPCGDCGTDISRRAARATLCIPCKTHRRNRRNWKARGKTDEVSDARVEALKPYLEQFDAFVRTDLGKAWALREVWPTINYGETL